MGADFDSDAGLHSGSAYLFDVITGTQITKLKATDAARDDWFGDSVAISGNTAIVGSPEIYSAAFNSGSAYLFGPVNQPGDFDGNGWVDGHDFLSWQRGGSPDLLNAADLADWVSHFGTGLSNSVARSATIPEPAAWIVFVLGISAAMCSRIKLTP